MLSDEDLLRYNREGLIPGPGETEPAFQVRAEYALHLKEEFAKRPADQNPFTAQEAGPEVFIQEVYPVTKRLFDIAPTWIPLFISNYKLSPWHGGCAWIFKLDEHAPTAAFFQLRKAFKSSERYLAMYSRKELIAHELAHVGRMSFEEPRYEELIAYRSAQSGFRRWFSPIVQSSMESALFVTVVGGLFLLDFFFLTSDAYTYYLKAMWLKLIPVAMILFALWRLQKKHRHFNACRQNLVSLLKEERKADAVIYRLSDAEIEAFAAMPPQEIGAYCAEQKALSLRWRLLATAYF